MDQENKTKPEENHYKPAELSDRDLEQVAGGIIIVNGAPAKPAGDDAPTETITFAYGQAKTKVFS